MPHVIIIWLVVWRKVCRPKKDGGLGLRCAREAKISLLYSGIDKYFRYRE